MYVGWTLLHVGAGLLARSPWVLAIWPVSFALVHRSVLHEERGLAQRFGRDFTEYRTRVPRYVGLPGRGT
jgi:protein-S-isoprenylcysteine O-methyltransferase Ste14